MAAFEWDLFLAHAGADAALAEQLYEQLNGRCRVFLDTRCLRLGDDWDRALAAAQRASLVTVVLVSGKTDDSYYQREEIAAAIQLARENEGHRVVPILLEPTAAPYGLRLKHGILLSEAGTLANCATRLLALIAQLRGELPARDPGLFWQPTAGWRSPVGQRSQRFKVVAFDLDGTLLRGDQFAYSWERVWNALGFTKEIQNGLKREYVQQAELDPSRNGRVQAYFRWCEKACEHFRRRGLTRARLAEIASPLRLTVNAREALHELRRHGLVTCVISGGMQTILEDRFPDYQAFFDFVFINELRFDAAGALIGVRPTAFDFAGKADALDLVCNRVGATLDETVFVGDRFNDRQIMAHAKRSIAYPPGDQIAADAANLAIDDDDLAKVLPHILE